MQRIILTILSIISILFEACIKEPVEFNSNKIVFYPTKFNFFSNGINTNLDVSRGEYIIFGVQDYRGANLFNNILRLPLQSVDLNNNRKLDGTLDYDFTNGSIQTNLMQLNDSNQVNDIVSSSENQYITTMPPEINKKGRKVALMDDNLNLLSQAFPKHAQDIRNFFHTAVLQNGDYIISHDIWTSNTEYFTCFDRNFNFKWRSVMPNPTFLCIGSNSILLAYPSEIKQFDYLGNKINTLPMESNYSIHNLTPVPEGFLVIGRYLRSDKFDDMFIRLYDNNLKLLKSNIIETKSFSANPNYKFYLRSNILVEKEGIYFIVNMRNPKDRMDPVEDAVLIRLNNNFIPEIIKIVDNRRIAFTSSLLARYKNEILCVGPGNWNGQKGYSFIKMNMDGIIQE